MTRPSVQLHPTIFAHRSETLHKGFYTRQSWNSLWRKCHFCEITAHVRGKTTETVDEFDACDSRGKWQNVLFCSSNNSQRFLSSWKNFLWCPLSSRSLSLSSKANNGILLIQRQSKRLGGQLVPLIMQHATTSQLFICGLGINIPQHTPLTAQVLAILLLDVGRIKAEQPLCQSRRRYLGRYSNFIISQNCWDKKKITPTTLPWQRLKQKRSLLEAC